MKRCFYVRNAKAFNIFRTAIYSVCEILKSKAFNYVVVVDCFLSCFVFFYCFVHELGIRVSIIRYLVMCFSRYWSPLLMTLGCLFINQLVSSDICLIENKTPLIFIIFQKWLLFSLIFWNISKFIFPKNPETCTIPLQNRHIDINLIVL